MMMGGRTLISSDSAVPMQQLSGQVARLAGNILRLPDRIQHRKRARQQPAAGLGQLDALANSLKQLGVQLRLQLLDLHGDCGLGIAQLLGRFGEILQLRNPHKGYDISDFHILTHQKN